MKVIYELRQKYPVKALVEYAGIKRSTYYVLVKKIGRPDPDTGLKAEIQAIYDEHEGRYGYRRIRDELQNRGQKVNHKRVQRLVKVLWLKCLVRLKKRQIGEKLYLSPVLDLFNGEINTYKTDVLTGLRDVGERFVQIA